MTTLISTPAAKAQQIKDADPELAEHLRKAIAFGYHPCYSPEPIVTWETSPVTNG